MDTSCNLFCLELNEDTVQVLFVYARMRQLLPANDVSACKSSSKKDDVGSSITISEDVRFMMFRVDMCRSDDTIEATPASHGAR